jgi:hypothetical protein
MAFLPHLPTWPEVVGHLLGALLGLAWLVAKILLVIALARAWLRLLP